MSYKHYQNIDIFATEWRKYETTQQLLTQENFRKAMQQDEYIKMQYINKKTGNPVLIFLLARGSKYAEQSYYLRRLLTRIKTPSDVILIAEKELKSYSKKAINTFSHLRVKTYLHEIFSLIIPNGPMCFPHRIMTKNEGRELLNENLYCYLHNLPKILEEDPQCIWIGAEVGDIIEIKSFTEINGEYLHYRVVVAKSAKPVSFRNREPESAQQDDVEEEEEEIQEIRNINVDDADEEDEE